MANRSILVKHFKEMILSQPNITQKQIQNLYIEQLNVHLFIAICKRVQKQILYDYKDGFKAKYAMLYKYIAELRHSNPRSTIKLVPRREQPTNKPKFKIMYICFTTCKIGWKSSCRPIIFLNGCFLEGLCKEQLLCVIGKDGNNQIFFLAQAVVDLESKKVGHSF